MPPLRLQKPKDWHKDRWRGEKGGGGWKLAFKTLTKNPKTGTKIGGEERMVVVVGNWHSKYSPKTQRLAQRIVEKREGWWWLENGIQNNRQTPKDCHKEWWRTEKGGGG